MCMNNFGFTIEIKMSVSSVFYYNAIYLSGAASNRISATFGVELTGRQHSVELQQIVAN